MPRNVTITLSNGESHTYRNVPDNVTPDQIEQRASSEYPSLRVTNISGGRKQVVKNAAESEPGSLASFGKGALAGATNVILTPIEWLVGGMEAMGVPGASTAPGKRDRALAQQQLEKYRRAHPNWFTAGQIAGETVASAPLISAGGAGITRAGGWLGQAAPKAGGVVQRVGRAVQTSGVGAGRTAAQTAKLGKAARAGQLAERMAGGAIAGTAGAALSGQDVTTGAAFGAGIPVVASILRRVGGRIADVTKMPRIKAAQIIRESLGANEDAARAAFAELSPDDQRLARQVLIDAGVEPRVFMGLGADVERLRPDEINLALEQQAAARASRLAEAGGGGTATARRQGIEQAARDVREATTPAREGALGAIQTTNQSVLDADTIAALARGRADEMTATGFVPRMRGLQERAGEQAAMMGDNPAYFPDMERIQQTRGISGAAGARADTSIAAQIGLRDLGREMDDYVAQLAAQGREPLMAAPLSSALRQQANAPGVRTSTAKRALLKLASQIEGAADQNGMLNPYDLYTLRKEASDIVEKYVASSAQPSTGSKKRAAGLVIGFKNAVDEALGPEFRDYITQHRTGMEAVNNRELAAEGARLAQESPNEFIAMMRGDRPKAVEDVMGRGTKNYDIANLAQTDPQRYMAMLQSARELETLNRMGELGRQGSTAAAELINRERPFLSRSLTRMGLAAFPPARIGAEASEMALSAFLQPRIQRELSNAFATGRNASSLMGQYPGSLRISEKVSQLPPEIRNVLAQMSSKGAVGNYPLVNPDTGEVLVGVGEIDGQPYPMYGPANQNNMRR